MNAEKTPPKTKKALGKLFETRALASVGSAPRATITTRQTLGTRRPR